MRSLISGNDTPFQQMPVSPFLVNYPDPSERMKTASIGGRYISDSHYLTNIIDFLKLQRQIRGFSRAELTHKARLSKGLIERAESKKQFPTTREFKGWCAALGLKWEDVWTLALFSQMELSR